jgi:hypothetical protein
LPRHPGGSAEAHALLDAGRRDEADGRLRYVLHSSIQDDFRIGMLSALEGLTVPMTVHLVKSASLARTVPSGADPPRAEVAAVVPIEDLELIEALGDARDLDELDR